MATALATAPSPCGALRLSSSAELRETVVRHFTRPSAVRVRVCTWDSGFLFGVNGPLSWDEI
jgi:hypothetical protein